MENKIDYTNTKCVDGFVSIKISLSCTGLKYQNENKVRICLAKQICNTFFDEYTNKKELCIIYKIGKTIELYCLVLDRERCKQEILQTIKTALMENTFSGGDSLLCTLEKHSDLRAWIKQFAPDNKWNIYSTPLFANAIYNYTKENGNSE